MNAKGFVKIFVVFFISLILIGGFFVLPVTVASWGIHHIYNFLRYQRKQVSIFIQLTNYIGWLFALIILIILPLMIFLAAEWEFAPSIIPFTTTCCALLWPICFLSEAKRLPPLSGTLVLCGMVVLILSLRYIDVNSRKPFLRDLGRINIGMTGNDVKTIMGKYDEQVTHYAPLGYQYLQPDFNGEEIYRHTDEGWGNADWGIVQFQNGQVVDVEFSHD